jgi:hypothetical protein
MPLVWENGDCVRTGREKYAIFEYIQWVGWSLRRLPYLKERSNYSTAQLKKGG